MEVGAKERLAEESAMKKIEDKRKKGIVVSVYLGHDDSSRAQRLLDDIERYAAAHRITHADKPALGKAIRAILEQFFATDAQ